MTLHHRRHIEDIRSAFDDDRSQAEFDVARSSRVSRAGSSGISPHTHHSTEYSINLSKPLPRRPAHVYSPDDATMTTTTTPLYFHDRDPQESPRSSCDTYASTVASEVEVEEFREDAPEYCVPEYSPQSVGSCAIPSTPSEFSDLFPSTRRLAVCHDASTLDGNMNLRIDADVLLPGNRRGLMTLFHLRMHDLRNREFSLRRYCRDSGREVCHSERKRPKPPSERRPSIQRSLSNALASMLPKSEPKSPTASGLARHDSGYGSMHSVEVDEDGRPRTADPLAVSSSSQAPPNTMRLEFSNYAQVVIKRTGNRGSRRYEFEYWGVHYAWRRKIRKTDGEQEASFHLQCTDNDRALAHIVPTVLSSSQAAAEEMNGGWIAPCSMWIADKTIVRAHKDIADVIIASGLMALVDDSIKRQFHHQDTRQLLIPVPRVQIGVEYIGPKRLFSDIFRRGDSHGRQTRRPSLVQSRRASSGPGSADICMPPRAIRQRSCEY